jgi:hypothetical protein
MDTGDLITLAVVGFGGYLIYQHFQQAALLTAGGSGAATGSVVHQCEQGYEWVTNFAGTGGSCLLKGSVT